MFHVYYPLGADIPTCPYLEKGNMAKLNISKQES